MSIAPNVTIIPAKAQTEISRSKYQQLRVAAYCRVSTEQEEQQSSYQVQIAYYTNLINRKKEWSLVGIFADEGISGTQTKNRTEFKRMIRMCKNKKIDLVITKSISRFARNTVDCLEYVRQLKDLGIGVIFEKENINTLTMTSEFMIALYGSFAQAESESISKNVSWGKEKAYREGRVQFQYKYLLGYKKGVDGKPEIVPEEAEIVRMIYKLFLDGYSMRNIKKVLESGGFLTATGKKVWNESLISSILKNEKYVGDALLQKTYTLDCITHKVVKNHGERPMYLVTDHHDSIVDRDTYNRVQQELARRSGKRKISDKTVTEQGKYSSKYALSELLICGHCGTPYRRTTWSARGKKQIVWRCISRLEHGKKYCPDSPTIKEELLHKAIIHAINNYYSCRNDIARILKANIGTVLECQGQEEMISIENRLKEIDQARNDLVSLIASGECDEDKLDSEFSRLYQEEQQLSERLDALKSQNKAIEFQPFRYIRKIRLGAEMPLAIRSAVRVIEANRDKQIVLNTDDGEMKVMISEIMYYETEKRKIAVHLKNGNNLLANKKVAEMQDLINKDGFIMIHRSCVVNADYVKNILNGIIVLDNDEKLVISRPRYKAVKQQLLKVWGEL